ncbi:hypothetical protein FOZ63_033633 [Perkinsus olseni]|uniref:Uncharacterized protein n=1 Tax=Perkinsus olseni TaxID=32597 RepID=A0A7J6U9N9_PEROL|nr:hypothetical protein FOZ62_003394 [Perkinsus olseni]KAF4753547.1 hypothetical protein FOZ63_033633 [Perkinsus olseni]
MAAPFKAQRVGYGVASTYCRDDQQFSAELLPTLRVFYLALAGGDAADIQIPPGSCGCVLGFFTAVWLQFELSGRDSGLLGLILKYDYVREVGFFSETESWQDFPYMDFVTSAARGRLARYERPPEYSRISYLLPRPIDGHQVEGDGVHALVVGEHLSLSLEVTSALVASFPKKDFTFDYHGHYAYCEAGQGIQDCSDPCNEVMKDFIGRNQRCREGHPVTGMGVDEFSVQLKACLPDGIEWDLVIATRSASISLGTWQIFREIPLLAISGGPLTFGLSRGDENRVMEFVRDPPGNAVFGEVGSTLSDAMGQLLTMRTSPVPSASFYTGSRADAESPRTGWEEIIVFRPRWFASCNQGALFSSMMVELFDEAGLSGRLRILPHDSPDMVSYQQFASERPLVVLFPDNTSKRALYDFYNMCLPVLVPSTELAVEVMRGTMSFNEMQSIFAPLGYNRTRIFIQGSDDIPGISRAYEASEFRRYPHLLRFGSIREMVEIAKDTARVERAVRGSCGHVRDVIEPATAAFYEASLGGVLGRVEMDSHPA